jgi:heme-binding HmuY-like protein
MKFSISNILLISFLVLLVTSCFKDEDEIITLPPRMPGDPKIATLDESIYDHQVYFNLSNDAVVAMNGILDWDLGFEASENGWHIILNPSTMSRAVSRGTDWDAVTSTGGIPFDDWKWDKSDGNMDSTAIGNWISFETDPPTFTNDVYIIDRGYDADASMLGHKKVQFTNFENNTYHFRVADLNGDNEFSASVTKDTSVNFVAFSFENGGETVVLEPNKNDWHIVFTAYTGITMLSGEPFPYFVRGVLLNPNHIQAVLDTTHLFGDFTYELVQTFDYDSAMDVIGHEWKYPVGDPMVGITYVCDTLLQFVVKTRESDYYKLRFLDFYNSTGDKGYITFEYQRL